VGIRLVGTTGATVRDSVSQGNGLHGIGLANASGNVVVGNRVHDNVSVSLTNTAVGIDVNSNSANNQIRGNRTWRNQDSGVQIYNGSNQATLARNISFNNGDHGFDTLASTGATYANNTAFGNRRDGISVEGNSTGAMVRNNVLVDNGVTTNEFNLYVDPSSAQGFSADYDMAFNHSKAPNIKFNAVVYERLSDLRNATGHESHGLATDPDFADAGAADFTPTPGSADVDSADAGAAGFASLDADGRSPLDDAIVPDSGTGPISYADRGALEVEPVDGATNYAPHVALFADPTTAAVPPSATITADGSGSSDADNSPITSYAFDFGDGSTTGPQSEPVAAHTYSTFGAFTIALTATDSAGAQTTRTATVTVTDRPLVTYHVEQTAPGCSDTASGTASAPLCSIGAALAKVLAGDTVLVGSGQYREQLRPVASGELLAPITLRAAADNVALVGTENLSGSGWTPTSTSAWSRPYTPAAAPTQVFVDDVAYGKAATAADVIPGTWYYDSSAQRLTLDVGGEDPGSGHDVEAGARNFALLARQVSDYVVSGFGVRGTNLAGVYLDQATRFTMTGLAITQAGSHGLTVDTSTDVRATDIDSSRNSSIGVRFWNSTGGTLSDSRTEGNGFHGVSVQGSSGVRISNVVTSHNLRPGTRVAAGVDVSASSTETVVEYCTAFANDDSGIEAYTASSDTVIRRNVVFDNGDHGIDSSGASGTRVLGNTVVGNETSGINFEGGSVNGATANNITLDNAVDSTRTIGEIRVDESSEPGFSAERDLVFQTSGGALFEWGSQDYSTIESFRAASGQESTGSVADPQFLDATGWDFRLQASSPAVDSADSSVVGWTAQDLAGNAPADHPSVDNTGVGPVTFADLGAHEFVGPIARAVVSATTGAAPLTVQVDGTQSVALGAPIVSYTWSCGDGVSFAQPTGSCQYLTVGEFDLRFTVVDGDGLTASWHTTVTVGDAPPVVVFTATPKRAYVPQDVVLDASGSTDNDGTPISGYRFSCGGGNWSLVQTSPVYTCTYTSEGSYTAGVTVYDTAGLSRSASTTVNILGDVAPKAVLTLSSSQIRHGSSITADGSASTSVDNSPIADYRFDCGNGQVTTWQPSPTTICSYPQKGGFTVRLWVRDTVALTSTTSKNVKVK
jgi:parallel beta-helix repeat protein